MIDPLREAAARWPHAPALVDPTSTRTWTRLSEDSERLAATMAVSTGTRVALLAEDTAAAVIAVHAIRLAGAVLVPLHGRLALPELADRLLRSGTGVLLHDPTHASVVDALAERVAISRLVSLDVSAWSDRGSAVVPSEGGGSGAIVFTSGTTAVSRGVLLSQRALLASAAAWNAFLESGPHDHWLSTLSLAHVAGLGMAIRPLLSGACLTVHERFDPDAVREAIEVGGVTVVSLVPTQLERLLDAGPIRAGTLRALLLGGGPVPPSLVRRTLAAGLPVITTYGLTEAASGVTALPWVEAAAAPGCAGRALRGVQVRVVDEHGADAGPGVAGSIVVGGPTLADGYVGDPAASGEAFSGGWLRTHDLGRLDADGRLWVLDRVDELIISGGENISPVEVEAILGMHPAVRDVAVVGRPDPAWGAVPVAAIVPRHGQPAPTLQALRTFGRAHLAAYKLPRDLRVLSAIARTASGKIVRREVLAALDAATPVSHEVARPDGAVIRVEEQGWGPPLVLLHATLSNARESRALATELARSFRVLSVDRRGAGASRMPSDDPGGSIDVRVHLDDLLATLEALAPGVAVLVAGHSFGGCVALELAAHRRDLVAGVWAFEPPYLSVLPAGVAPPGLAALGDRVASVARDEGPVTAALVFLDAVRGPGTAARLPAAARQRLGAEGRAAVADAGLVGFDPDGLGRITSPVVIGVGGRGEGLYAAIAGALSSRIETASIERFADLGHGGPVSQPTRVVPSIIGLARRAGLPGRAVRGRAEETG